MRIKMNIMIAVFVIGILGHAMAGTVAAASEGFDQALELLKDSDILNDQQAIDALVVLGPPVLERLFPLLPTASRDMKAALVEVFGRMGDKRAYGPLKNELDKVGLVRKEAETFADSYIRIMIIKAFGELGDTRAIEFLPAITASQDIYERTHAWIALDRLGHQPAFVELETIARGPDENCRNIVIIAAGRIDNKKSLPMLMSALEDEKWFIRASAIDSLAIIGDTSSIERIQMMTKDRSPYVRQAAADALEKLKKSAR